MLSWKEYLKEFITEFRELFKNLSPVEKAVVQLNMTFREHVKSQYYLFVNYVKSRHYL